VEELKEKRKLVETELLEVQVIGNKN